MSIKRWAGLLVLGVLLTSLSVAMGIAWVYRTHELPAGITHLVQIITLQAIPHPVRGIFLFLIGFGVLGFAIWRMISAIIAPLIAKDTEWRKRLWKGTTSPQTESVDLKRMRLLLE